MISKRTFDNIPTQIEFLNMVIPIIMQFSSFVSKWSLASHINLHVVQQNVTLLMTSNWIHCGKFFMLSNQMSCYKSKCIRLLITEVLSLTLTPLQYI